MQELNSGKSCAVLATPACRLHTAVNGEHHEGLTYGGGIVGWEPWTSRRFGLNVRSLIGFGHGTTTDTVTLETRDRRGTVVGMRDATQFASSDLFMSGRRPASWWG